MRRSSVRVLTVALASIAFAACKNGSNNGYDTNGIGAGSAAGQVPPSSVTPGGAAATDTGAGARMSGATAPGGIDTSRRDSTHRSKRP